MRENEIVKLPYLWRRRPDEQPWLVVFSLALLNDRLECVGMEIRSYVRRQHTDGQGEVYEAYEPDGKRLMYEEVTQEAWRAIVRDDPAAVAKNFLEEADLSTLRALTLRELPFADALARARRYYAEFWDWWSAQNRGSLEALLETGQRSPTIGDAAPEQIEALVGELDELAGLLLPPLQKSGRRAKYTLEHLKIVARLYGEAYASGSTSPTKDVAEKLGLPRNQVAKLVMRCRDPQVGLLDATEKRRAGGVKPHSHPSRKPSS